MIADPVGHGPRQWPGEWLSRRRRAHGRAEGQIRFPWRYPARQPAARAPSIQTYDPKASEQDIYACFRLLLGRNPNQEEIRGHMMRAGEDLPSVVASYLGSLEFSARGLGRPNAQDEPIRTETEGFQIYSAPGDAAVGKYVRADNYEREVTAVFRRFLRDGMHVLDIGANIGYFTMLSAKLVGSSGRVTAVEPNPRNVRLLEASRRANGFDHVAIWPMAAARDVGLLALHTTHSNGTTSDLRPGIAAVLDAELVPAMRLDPLLASMPPVDFIKIDVEGAEYNALLGCRAALLQHRPIIVSEFSPNLMPGIASISGEDYLRWLIGLGYSLSVIEPDGSLMAAGKDADLVMRCHTLRGIDHIDIVAIAD